MFLQASDGSLHAVVNCCMANDCKEDSILIERWKKEVEVKNGKYVPLFQCVTVDCFGAPCLLWKTNMNFLRTWEVMTDIY